MSLSQWYLVSGVLPTHPTTERKAVSVVIDHSSPHRPALWHLTDYVVSGVSGVVVWLVLR